MKKLLALLIILMLNTLNIQAKSANPSADFSKILKEFGANKNSVSISVRNLKNGNVTYAINDKSLMNPASVQKIITMPAVLDTLGEDYKFSTELYSSGKDSYTIKLSGDPYLKSDDFKSLVFPVKIETKNIYIDSSVLDDKTWGEGWQWDDDLNTLMPRFGAYNLDGNLIKLTIIPGENGKFAQIINPTKYPLVFYNQIWTSNITNLDIKRDPAVANTLIMTGTIARPATIYIPVINIKQYFEIQLRQALENHKVYMKNPYKPYSGKELGKKEKAIEHSLSYALSDILKNSNNMAAETVFKLSGGKYRSKSGGNSTGTDEAGIEMFNAYCKKIKIDNSGIKITDGSGVSKNNLLSSDFVSEYLYAIKDSNIVNYMAKPGEGTLTQRLLPVKDNLRAKTGTLSGISSIAGYITTRNGNKYAFCIIQNDVRVSAYNKKQLEDDIIKEIYLKL